MPFQKGEAKRGGRKKGTPNKATLKREAEIAESGLTPLDYMLTMLRDVNAKMEDRMWAAEKAAPYVHPKLASVNHTGSLEIGEVSVGKPYPED